MTSNWFFLSTLNYDARSTAHQLKKTSIRIVEVKPDNSQKVGANVIEDYGQKSMVQAIQVHDGKHAASFIFIASS